MCVRNKCVFSRCVRLSEKLKYSVSNLSDITNLTYATYYEQLNSLRLISSVASKWAVGNTDKHLWGYHLFCR